MFDCFLMEGEDATSLSPFGSDDAIYNLGSTRAPATGAANARTFGHETESIASK
ncbi:MAG: hypothetical protein WBE58_17345 [Verrucomicrobiales bacterium]|nr:hypothetical protein [Verrucomicrobiales bacterium]